MQFSFVHVCVEVFVLAREIFTVSLRGAQATWQSRANARKQVAGFLDFARNDYAHRVVLIYILHKKIPP